MNSLAQSLADQFGSRLVTASSARAQYAQSEGHQAHQPPSLVAQPETIAEVQLLVKKAAEENYSIVAYGAGTSLEGNAATISADTLCIDFSRMNRIVEVSAADLLCVVEPGVTREQLNEDIRAAPWSCYAAKALTNYTAASCAVLQKSPFNKPQGS